MQRLFDILVSHPGAVWSDGTLWHESEEMLANFPQASLEHAAVERDGMLYLLDANGCDVGGFALQRLDTSASDDPRD